MPYIVQNSINFFKQEDTSVVAYKNTCMHESAVTAHIMHREFFLYTANHQIELCQ